MAKPDPNAVVVAVEAFCCNTLSGLPAAIAAGQRLRADDELALRFGAFFVADGSTSAEVAQKRHALYAGVYDAA
jgi:hypothetical protein